MSAWVKVDAQQGQQVDALKENITLDINNIGDGHFSMSITYNASQWENYQRIVGSNAADFWKRQMSRSLPSWYLENWTYKEEPMSRTWTLAFDALGIAKVNDEGNWVVDLEQKNPDITKMSDRNYAMTNTMTSGGVLTQQLWKINLPAAASNISQDKDAFGKTIFTFEMTPGHSGLHIIYLITGVLLLAAGIVAYLKPQLVPGASKKQQVKPFTVVSAQTPAVTTEPPAVDPGQKVEKQA